jgi:hypothetical protein
MENVFSLKQVCDIISCTAMIIDSESSNWRYFLKEWCSNYPESDELFTHMEIVISHNKEVIGEKQ